MKIFGKLIIICVIFSICFVTFKLRLTDNNQNSISKYDNCELGDLVGEDVIRIQVAGFNVDYHSNDFSKKQIEEFAKMCKRDGVSSQYQMDCCMTIKMYPDEE